MTGTLTKSPRHSLSPWFRGGPFGPLREMEDLFGRFFGEEGDGWGMQMLAPAMDVSETDQAVNVRLDLPGVEPEQIDIQVSGNQLTIAGERKEEKEEKGETYHRIERHSGRFSRSMTLPCAVDENNVDATYNDGVLSVALPKAEESKARRIPVKPK